MSNFTDMTEERTASVPHIHVGVSAGSASAVPVVELQFGSEKGTQNTDALQLILFIIINEM